MASRSRVAVLLLALSLGTGIFGLHVLGTRPDGLLSRLRSNGASAFPKWPGTTRPLKRAYTGFKPIDKVLSALNPAFAPVLDGNDPSLSLWGLFMFGQLGISLGLSTLEGYRLCNRGKVASFTTLFFLLGQLAGWGVAFPIYALVYTLTSPLADLQAPTTARSKTLVPINILKIFPYTFLLTFLIPSILPLTTTNPSTRQLLLGIWQPFPLWASIFTGVASLFVSSPLSTSVDKAFLPIEKKTYTSHLQKAYTFLLAFGSITHIAALSLTLFPQILSVISPNIAKSLQQHNPTISSVYIPHVPSLSYRTSSLADATHIFLWWDLYAATAAGLVWGVTLLRSVKSKGSGMGVVGKVALWSGLAGPWGGVLAMVSERDARALEVGEKRVD